MGDLERPGNFYTVMAGLVPAIHVFFISRGKTWMPGTRPGITGRNGQA